MKALILSSTPAPKQVEMLSYLVFEGEKLPHSIASDKIKRAEFTGGDSQIFSIDNLDGYDSIVYVGLGKKKDCTPLTIQQAVATAIRMAVSKQVRNTGIILPAFENMEEIGARTMIGAKLGAYQFLRYKTDEKTKNKQQLESVIFKVTAQTDSFKKGMEKGSIIADGVMMTRDLVNDPASHTNTHTLTTVANSIAKTSSQISVKVLSESECKKLGMGSYLAVAKGSVAPPQFIILHYKPKTKSIKKVALIGKSIVFDSGGLSLKPSEAMEDMKIDMAGGATVLGVFKILAELSNHPSFAKAIEGKEVFGILPACENMPSGHATRPGDIATSLNGKTIEILNTDAEGRLTLADALVYAEKHCKAEILIDLATLTGACMVALGRDLTGMFSNNDDLASAFEAISKESGDDLWKMPLHMPYLKKMKSEIADLKNIGGGRYGGAITAAVFLSEFVDKAKWIHFDIAGPAYRADEPKGVLSNGATGWGVQLIVKWLSQ